MSDISWSELRTLFGRGNGIVCAGCSTNQSGETTFGNGYGCFTTKERDFISLEGTTLTVTPRDGQTVRTYHVAKGKVVYQEAGRKLLVDSMVVEENGRPVATLLPETKSATPCHATVDNKPQQTKTQEVAETPMQVQVQMDTRPVWRKFVSPRGGPRAYDADRHRLGSTSIGLETKSIGISQLMHATGQPMANVSVQPISEQRNSERRPVSRKRPRDQSEPHCDDPREPRDQRDDGNRCRFANSSDQTDTRIETASGMCMDGKIASVPPLESASTPSDVHESDVKESKTAWCMSQTEPSSNESSAESIPTASTSESGSTASEPNSGDAQEESRLLNRIFTLGDEYEVHHSMVTPIHRRLFGCLFRAGYMANRWYRQVWQTFNDSLKVRFQECVRSLDAAKMRHLAKREIEANLLKLYAEVSEDTFDSLWRYHFGKMLEVAVIERRRMFRLKSLALPKQNNSLKAAQASAVDARCQGECYRAPQTSPVVASGVPSETATGLVDSAPTHVLAPDVPPETATCPIDSALARTGCLPDTSRIEAAAAISETATCPISSAPSLTARMPAKGQLKSKSGGLAKRQPNRVSWSTKEPHVVIVSRYIVRTKKARSRAVSDLTASPTAAAAAATASE